VTTPAARRFSAVDQQLALAKEIVETAGWKDYKNRKQVTAAHIKNEVTNAVREASKLQGEIDREEKERLFREQRGLEIKVEVQNVKKGIGTLAGSLHRLGVLWHELPGHPQFGDLVGSLDDLGKTVERFKKVVARARRGDR
jgi:hypothetical protein